MSNQGEIAYRGIPVGTFVENIEHATLVINACIRPWLDVKDYNEQFGEKAIEWQKHLNSDKVLKCMVAALDAKTPRMAAGALRAAQVEEALTFFMPYFLFNKEKDSTGAYEAYWALYNTGCFDGLSLPSSVKQGLTQTVAAHSDFFINLGAYERSIIPMALYDSYIICEHRDKIPAMRVQVNAADMLPIEPELSDEELLADYDARKSHDGVDFTQFEEDEDDSDVEDVEEQQYSGAWQEVKRKAHPRLVYSSQRIAQLNMLAGSVEKDLRDMDELRLFAKTSMIAGPYMYIRPAIVATQFGAAKFAQAVGPKFRVYTSDFVPVPIPA